MENIGLGANVETEIAFVQNDVTYYAWTGTESIKDKDKITNIRGMGLPTTAKHIVLATMAVPALIQLNVNLLAAHLFILYFGVNTKKGEYLPFKFTLSQIMKNRLNLHQISIPIIRRKTISCYPFLHDNLLIQP